MEIGKLIKLRKKREFILIAILVFSFLLLGGVFLLIQKRPFKAEVTLPAPRSVRLNNYGNWFPPLPSDSDYEAKVNLLAYRDEIMMTDLYSLQANLTPAKLKTINPNAHVYAVYDLSVKNNWETDVAFLNWSGGCQDNLTGLQTPLPCQVISTNDWWLRDGNGNIVLDKYQNGNTRFLDVGKPGFKEAYLSYLLDRLQGRGYEGVVFDYWHNNLAAIIPEGVPRPPAYPGDYDWWSKAWLPFITYVMQGVHNAGYQIIGNGAGEYFHYDSRLIVQRSLIDGVVSEQVALDYVISKTPGGWLQGYQIEQRINALSQDPKIYWLTEDGIKVTQDYDRAQRLSLAMYYIGIPDSQTKRSYGHSYDKKVTWEPLWDLNIGTPAEPAKKMEGKYFWSRLYTDGIVLFNYDTQSVSYTLPQKYIDEKDHHYPAGTITLPEHTGLVLKIDSGRAASPSPTNRTASPSPTKSSLKSPTTRSKSPSAFPSTSPTEGISSPEATVSPEAISSPEATASQEEVSQLTPEPITTAKATPSPIPSRTAFSSPQAIVQVTPSMERSEIEPTPSQISSGKKIKAYLISNKPVLFIIILFIFFVPLISYFLLRRKIREKISQGEQETSIK